jgi:hypothetical protein
VRFVINNWPAHGPYALQFLDLGYLQGDPPTAANTTSIALAL